MNRLMTILISAYLVLAAVVSWADPVSGTVKTVLEETESAKNLALDNSLKKSYADQVGANGDQYLAQYQQRYRGLQTLSGTAFEVVVKQPDGSLLKISEGKTGTDGSYSTDIPSQYQSALADGKVSLVFYADTDRSNVTRPVWAIGALMQSKYEKSGEIAIGPGGGELTISSNDTPYSREFTGSNHLMKTVDKLNSKVDTAKAWMPENLRQSADLGKVDIFYPSDEKIGLSIMNKITSGTTAMTYHPLTGKRWIEVKGEDANKVLDEEKFDFFGHEYGHYVFAGLVGGDYASYSVDVEKHDLGAITGNEKFATNESFAYFFAGVSQELPQSLYKKDYIAFAKNEYIWNEKETSPAGWGATPADAKSNRDRAIGSMKRTLDELEAKVNSYENLTPADRNTIEGYFTEYLNEIYFGGQFNKDEALGKTMSVIAAKKPKNVDEFIAGWKEMFPGDAGKLDQVMINVDKKIFEEIRDYIRQKREWLDSLGVGTTAQPVPASFIPGGLAVSPVTASEFYVTDNSAGRLLAIIPGDFDGYRQIALLTALDRPGDVDISDGGRSLVLAEQSKVRKLFFGLTAVINDAAGQPLTGAGVVLQGDFPTITTKTDTTGTVSIMNLVKPNTSDYLVRMTVTHMGKSQVFTLGLNYTGQKVVSLVFTGN